MKKFINAEGFVMLFQCGANKSFAQETELDCKHMLTVAIGNFISTIKSISAFVCMQRREMGRTEEEDGQDRGHL